MLPVASDRRYSKWQESDRKRVITNKGVIVISVGKKAVVLVLLLSLTVACAQAAQKVSVAKKGTYVYWFTFTDAFGKESVTQPVKFKGKSADVDVAPLGTKFTGAKLHVMDKKTGNIAIADYAAPKDPEEAKPIQFKSDAFQYVRTVRLRAVSKDGAPLESGVVEITDGEGTPMRAVLTPADAGTAVFENVAAGEISVKVKAEGVERTIDSDIELSAERKAPGFERDIKVAGDVDTLPVAAEVKSAANGKPTTRERSSGGGLSGVLQALAGLIFLAIVAAVVWAVVRSKGITTKQALEKMGVQFPEASPVTGQTIGETGVPAVDPNVCAFCGSTKDATGNCACTVAPGGVASAVSAQSAAGIPRLVGSQGTYSGHIFEIASDSTVIGRDSANPVALPNDSTASRRHATISKSNGDFVIRDEGSSNGTFVNGARITEQKLVPGDEVQIGGTRFRFEV